MTTAGIVGAGAMGALFSCFFHRAGVEFRVYEKDRATVKTMSAFGIPDYEIAKGLGIDPKTLRKHFWTEIEVGHVEANAKVAASLFKKATGDGREAVVAAIFWLKCRAGWRERPAADELGKKEQRALEAETAERGTSWESLLEPASTRLQ